MTRVEIIFFLFVFVLPFKVSAIVINEIAWMGTEIQWQNEWLELYNPENKEINLSGWILKAKDGSPFIELEGVIKPKSYFLLERTDDSTVENIKADQIYKGGLKNSGEHILLLNSKGELVDEIDCSLGWLAGNNDTKRTMEKNKDSWRTSFVQSGTPKAQNSQAKSIVKKPLRRTNTAYSSFSSLFAIGFFLSLLFSALCLQLKKKKAKINNYERT